MFLSPESSAGSAITRARPSASEARQGRPFPSGKLEKACLDWAEDFKETIVALPEKDKRIAIAGAGLSGLTAAFDLAKKGYSVDVFEKESRPGGSLFRLSEEQLPEEAIAADLKCLERSALPSGRT